MGRKPDPSTPRCKNCPERAARVRGFCTKCAKNNPPVGNPFIATARCGHCGLNPVWSRRLCRHCHAVPEILALFPRLSHKDRKVIPDSNPDPTAAQLEAIIAEQMKSLPDWWLLEEENKLDEANKAEQLERLRVASGREKPKTKPSRKKVARLRAVFMVERS